VINSEREEKSPAPCKATGFSYGKESMRKYDILFLDIDGTLIASDHFTLSPRNRQALTAARQAGVKLSIASGRCLKILPQQVMDFGFDYAITSNGAAVQDLKTGEVLYRNGLSARQAALAYGVLRPRTDYIEWFADGEILLAQDSYDLIGTHEIPPWHAAYFSQGNTPVVSSVEEYIAQGAPGLEKIAIVRYPKEVIAAIVEGLRPLNEFKLASSIGRSLEIVRADCDKAAAIRVLCEKRGFDMARTAACGDAGNDVEMLAAVGCGAAMGNAKDSVKALAACVTASNDEDGVAQFIEEHVL